VREKESRDYKNLVYALQFLYPLKNEPGYSAVPELLPFVGLEGFLSLCKYFGGHTISVPTLAELNSLLIGIELYTKVHMRGMSEETALEKTRKEIGELPRDAYKIYRRVTELYEEIDND